MSERITLRAKSDGTEISGELIYESASYWCVQLAKGVSDVALYGDDWDRVYGLPTKVGTVFRATVFGEPNTRVMVSTPVAADDRKVYVTATRTQGGYFHDPEDIDASTVVTELEGDGDE